VCQQENGVDCGVFVIKYVEMILNANPTSTPEDIRTEFHDYFQPLMFSQTDADVERIKFINDIDV
jgi:Ulp1 family protease